ncbi:MAG: PadR family transcriptional regulator [Acidimicrobiales bacterium]
MTSAARERTLTEWVVLGLLAEAPAHGFSLTRLLAPGGEIGRVWAASRPLTYRAIDQLAQDDLIVTAGTESGRGPRRTLHELTPEGRAALRGWLRAPVSRFRDVRAELLVKLVLLERSDRPSTTLLAAQRRTFAPLLAQVRSLPATDPVSRWRKAQAEAIAGFLELR